MQYYKNAMRHNDVVLWNDGCLFIGRIKKYSCDGAGVIIFPNGGNNGQLQRDYMLAHFEEGAIICSSVYVTKDNCYLVNLKDGSVQTSRTQDLLAELIPDEYGTLIKKQKQSYGCALFRVSREANNITYGQSHNYIVHEKKQWKLYKLGKVVKTGLGVPNIIQLWDQMVPQTKQALQPESLSIFQQRVLQLIKIPTYVKTKGLYELLDEDQEFTQVSVIHDDLKPTYNVAKENYEKFDKLNIYQCDKAKRRISLQDLRSQQSSPQQQSSRVQVHFYKPQHMKTLGTVQSTRRCSPKAPAFQIIRPLYTIIKL